MWGVHSGRTPHAGRVRGKLEEFSGVGGFKGFRQGEWTRLRDGCYRG